MNTLIKFSLLAFSLILIAVGCEKTSTNEEQAPVEQEIESDTTPRVTGIGGIFFKSTDTDSLKSWYAENLGLKVNAFGSSFEFRNANDPEDINYLIWSLFADSADYFNPSEKQFMINYRVNDLEELVEKLEDGGATVVDSIAEYPYGKFIHIMDPEGNKIELWEPADEALTEMGGETTK